MPNKKDGKKRKIIWISASLLYVATSIVVVHVFGAQGLCWMIASGVFLAGGVMVVKGP